MKKKKGFILYVDILGYCNLLQSSDKQEIERISNIIESFASFHDKFNFNLVFGNNFNKSKLFKRFFSDNFLFLYEADENDRSVFNYIKYVATLTQRQFLEVGLLTRGSISYGEISYTEDIVFGLSLVNAVKLEESHLEPSIIVDDHLLKVFGLESTSNTVDLFDVWADSTLDYEFCVDGIKKCILNANKANLDNRVIQKIDWVIDQLNDYFADEQKIKYRLVVNHDLRLEKM